MFDSVRKASREPLLHFLVAGGGLFLLYGYAADRNSVADDQIIVSSAQIDRLAVQFDRSWQRAPTAQEVQGLIDEYVLEEVLYREAKSIGLDQDDAIVRRRLKQKMELLVDDVSPGNPSDDELQQFLQSYPDRFRTDSHITFEQIYLVDSSIDAARAMLSRLQEGESVDPDLSAAAVLLPRSFENVSESIVARQFGEVFTAKLFALPEGRWIGPVESPFGIHLVRIDEILPGEIPVLAEIRNVVQREWLASRRRAAREAFFEKLKAKYTITIEAYEASE